jgi:hypothetical protein
MKVSKKTFLVGLVFFYPTDWTTERSKFESRHGKKIFASPCRANLLWGPSSLLFNWYREIYVGVKRQGSEVEAKKALIYIFIPSYIFMT